MKNTAGTIALRAVFWGALLASFSLGAQGAPKTPPDQRVTSRLEVRASLNGLLDDWFSRNVSTGNLLSSPSADFSNAMIRLLRSYRSDVNPTQLAIKDSPYLFLIVNEKIDQLYSGAGGGTPVALPTGFFHTPIEPIFDTFVDGIIRNSLPPLFAEAGEKVGLDLARKVKSGKGEDCVVVPFKAGDEPGTLTLAWVKYTANFPIPSACFARQVIYGVFDQAFQEQLSQKVSILPELVSRKFRGEKDSLWDSRAPLIETESDTPEGGTANLNFKGFVAGLRADVRVAALFAKSANSEERGLAAPLFYAAANRLLLLTGGTQAKWDGSRFHLSEPADFRTNKRFFKTESFGGWGVQKKQSSIRFSNWDWAAYDPLREGQPTAFRLLPSEFRLRARGIPLFIPGKEPTESLEDLADFLTALLEFLQVTHPATGTLAEHFGDEATLGDHLLDEEHPVLFPRAGRMLAVGMLATLIKNLVTPGYGHLELTDPTAQPESLGLIFHEKTALSGRKQGAPTKSVAKILLAAFQLRQVLGTDPDFPADLNNLKPTLETAIQMGNMVLRSQTQAGDGGFYETLLVPQSSGRRLSTAVASIRALTSGYSLVKGLPFLLSIRQGWAFLEKFWEGGRGFPSGVEGENSVIRPEDAWELLSLWRETQEAVRPILAQEVEWNHWDSRFSNLRQKLLDQLKTPEGPQNF